MEENKSIFRKKSLNRISSPEDLDNYLTVTGPGIWFVLIAVIVLLIGIVCWGIFGRLETTVNIAVISSENSVTCLVPSDELEDVLAKGSLQINGKSYKITDVGRAQMVVTENFDSSIRLAGALEIGTVVNQLNVENAVLDDGIYEGKVTVETVKPISFIIN